MLREDEFASMARVTSGEFAGQDVAGIFEDPVTEAFSVGASTPAFVAPDDYLLAQGDHIEIAGVAYRLKLPEPDSTGLIRYPLTEV